MDKVKVIAQLKIDEALKLKPYKDTVGKTTIGIGRNLDDRGITKEEAEFLCSNDIDIACADLDRSLSWWRGISEARQNVLVNMCFNMGITRLLGFKNTLHLMYLGKWEEASEEMLESKWAKQVGERAKRLAKMIKEG